MMATGMTIHQQTARASQKRNRPPAAGLSSVFFLSCRMPELGRSAHHADVASAVSDAAKDQVVTADGAAASLPRPQLLARVSDCHR